jgi:osmotically-inducible protein OsmY
MLLGGMLLAGCASSHSDGRDTSRTAWETTKEGFGTAYNGVKTGAKAVAHAGGWVLEKAGDGVVKVMYKAKAGKVARATQDGWITTKLKGEYALDPNVRAGRINIDTSHGVVTLTGVISSAHEAECAIRRALDTDGVVAVRSKLEWPTVDQARMFEKGDDVRFRE